MLPFFANLLSPFLLSPSTYHMGLDHKNSPLNCKECQLLLIVLSGCCIVCSFGNCHCIVPFSSFIPFPIGLSFCHFFFRVFGYQFQALGLPIFTPSIKIAISFPLCQRKFTWNLCKPCMGEVFCLWNLAPLPNSS